MKKRLLSLLLVFALCLSLFTVTAMADHDDELEDENEVEEIRIGEKTAKEDKALPDKGERPAKAEGDSSKVDPASKIEGEKKADGEKHAAKVHGGKTPAAEETQVPVLMSVYSAAPLGALEEADEFSVYVGGVGMNDGDYLASGAEEVTDTAPETGGYAYYKNGVLTLNNYEYSGEGYMYDSSYSSAIYAPNDLTIKLVGESEIENTVYESDGITPESDLEITVDDGVEGSLIITADYGIYADDDVTISGGEVSIDAYYYGIDTYDGDVAISGGEVRIYSEYYYCIYAEYDVTISGGEVSIDSNDSDGIYADDDVTISGGKVNIEAEYDGIEVGYDVIINGGDITIDAGYYGIYTYACFDMCGGRLDASGGDYAVNSDYSIYVSDELAILLPEGGYISDYSIFDADDNAALRVIIDKESYADHDHDWDDDYDYNGTYHWHPCTEDGCWLSDDASLYDGYEEHDYSNGDECICGKMKPEVYVGDAGLADGEYVDNNGNVGYAEAEDDLPTDIGYAWYKDGELTLNDYEYFGEGYVYGEEYYYSALIYSEKDLEIVIKGENSLETLNDKDGEGIALSDADLTISGDGSLEVIADDEAININGDGGVAIKGGTLYFESEDEEGIQAGDSGDITISGGTVTIVSDEDGLDTDDGDVKISGGTVSIEVLDDNDSGISASGDVTISGGTVDIETYDGYGISGDTVTFSGGETTISVDEDSGYFAVMAYEEITLGSTVSVVEPEDGSVGEYGEYEDEYGDTGETILDSDGSPATYVVIEGADSGNISLSGIGAVIAAISELDVYHIDMENIKHGKVTASKDMASAGDIVTLTPVADRGYELARIRVLDENGKEVKLTANGNGSYTFTMPSGDVTVGALFEQGELTLGEMTTSDILTSDSLTAQLIRAEAAK